MSDVATKLIRLFTEFPCAGTNDADFSIEMERDFSEAAYQVIIKHIEFRRKCMNQGFDNLLELLTLHRDAMREAEGKAQERKQGAQEPQDHPNE